MTVTNFDSGSLVVNSSAVSATYSGWTFGSISGNVINIANADNSDLPLLLNQFGGRSIILNYGSASEAGFYFKSTTGSDFKLNSFNLDNGWTGASHLLDGCRLPRRQSGRVCRGDRSDHQRFQRQY